MAATDQPILPFLPEFHKKILDGRKTCTARTKRYADPGTILETNAGVSVRLTHVERVSLGFVAGVMFEREGTESPADFLTVWSRIHPRRELNSADPVWLHVFEVA